MKIDREACSRLKPHSDTREPQFVSNVLGKQHENIRNNTHRRIRVWFSRVSTVFRAMITRGIKVWVMVIDQIRVRVRVRVCVTRSMEELKH